MKRLGSGENYEYESFPITVGDYIEPDQPIGGPGGLGGLGGLGGDDTCPGCVQEDNDCAQDQDRLELL